MSYSRRDLLKALGSSALALNLPLLPRMAQAASDYKALVCVFLFGGNDGNNMVIPADNTGYAKYSKVRGDSTVTVGALGIPQSQLVGLSDTAGNTLYGLHPDLTDLQGVWTANELAVLFNTGPLIKPLTKTSYQQRTAPIPLSLFSHSDQQLQWQSAISGGPARNGWGGRMADAIRFENGSATLPVIVSTGGTALFTLGARNSPLAIPESGGFGLSTFSGSQGANVASAYQTLLGADRGNSTISAAEDIASASLSNSKTLSPILTASASSSTTSAFGSLNTSIANQLKQVAKIIENRSTLGVSREIFFVALGGFDTHTDQINRQSALFKQLGPALKSFRDAMNGLSLGSSVTTFTLSDFARTFKPASGGGSDHAWGNHHLVMGGAVKGRQFYGQFPDLTLGGADDVSSEGRWLPTTSVDQYGATLASWFGVPQSQLATVFPSLGNFSTQNLGFV